MPLSPLLGVALACLTPTDAPTRPPRAEAVPLLAHAELGAALRAVADAHPTLVELHRVATSREGRAVEALRLTGPMGGDAPGLADRPGILLVANLEGPRVFESAVALHHARRLAEGYATEDAIRDLLDRTVVWIVPRANPDAAEARFVAPRMERTAGGVGVDDDRDGRQGEDPPGDVDGDGLVTSMRVRDPDGEWMEDPTDARVLVRADRAKGERGLWKLHPEGRDRDGDERVAEDAPLDARVDRNFPSYWEAHAPASGAFPTDEPEVRGLAELVMARRELGLVLVYDGVDNLVGEPKSVADDAPAVKRVPARGVLASDAELLEELGRRYREATGNETGAEASDDGTFGLWTYDHRGLVTLSARLWTLPTEAPPAEAPEAGGDESPGEEAPSEEGASETGDEEETDASRAEPSTDAKHLTWIDATGEGWRFVDWTPFEHPELGSVEIGGFAPFARHEPPQEERLAIAEAHLGFLLELKDVVARVRLAECTKTALGEGLWEVTAVLQNDSLLPLLSRSARRTRTIRPARVRLELPDAATLLSGRSQELVSELSGSGGRHELTWLVLGPRAMDIGVRVDTDHAGSERRLAEVAP